MTEQNESPELQTETQEWSFLDYVNQAIVGVQQSVGLQRAAKLTLQESTGNDKHKAELRKDLANAEHVFEIEARIAEIVLLQSLVYTTHAQTQALENLVVMLAGALPHSHDAAEHTENETGTPDLESIALDAEDAAQPATDTQE